MKVKRGLGIIVGLVFIIIVILTVKAKNSKASEEDYLVSGLEISSVDTTRFSLTWRKYNEVNRYWILQEKENGVFEKIDEVDYLYYSKNRCNPGTYMGRFAVMAVNDEYQDKNYINISDTNKTVKVLTRPESITNIENKELLVAENKSDRSYVELEWNPCEGADKYYVYEKKNDQNYVLVDETIQHYDKIFFDYDEKLSKLEYKIEVIAEKNGVIQKSLNEKSIEVLPRKNLFNLKQIYTYKENSVTIGWSAGFYCTIASINVYRNGRWERISSVNCDDNEYTITGLRPGETINVQIRDSLGKCIEDIKCVTAPKGLSALTVSDITDETVMLHWKKEKGVSYGVFKYNFSTKGYDIVRNVGNVDCYKCTGLYGNTACEYMVAPIITHPETGAYYYSLENPATVPFITELDTVKNVKIIGMSDDSVQIAWNKVKTALGYNVYVYNKENKLIKQDKTKECNYVYKAEKGNKIEGVIKIEAYADKITGDNKKNIIKSYKLAAISISNALKEPTNLRTSERVKGYVKLVWASVEGAQKYEVYKVTKDSKGNKKYTSQGTTKTLHMEFEKDKLEDKTIFVVKAISENNGEKVESNYSKEYEYVKQ